MAETKPTTAETPRETCPGCGLPVWRLAVETTLPLIGAVCLRHGADGDCAPPPAPPGGWPARVRELEEEVVALRSRVKVDGHLFAAMNFVSDDAETEVRRLRSLLRHATYRNHEPSPSACTPCEYIAAALAETDASTQPTEE